MRIIAGTKRGQPIAAPKGRDTRPTLDRVKESLFGIIQFEIAGKTVLDLFAGSGNLGLEALSRGAEHAVFNDAARESAAVVRTNVERLGFCGNPPYIRWITAPQFKLRRVQGSDSGLCFLIRRIARGFWKKRLPR